MDWVQIRIPAQMEQEIQDILRAKPGFWINVHDFIRDALREKIEQLNCDDKEA